ncbi:MAG: GPW/gp25 family protein [Cyclobacteriaceae bacterium]
MNQKSFLGTGWKFPPQFSKSAGSVIMTSEEQNIIDNLDVLFKTKVGERIMNFDYGSKLNQLVFDKIGAKMEGDIEETITNAILFYEPRINLQEIIIDDSSYKNGLINIQVNYVIRQTNNRGNYVYPFYLNEGTNLI